MHTDSIGTTHRMTHGHEREDDMNGLISVEECLDLLGDLCDLKDVLGKMRVSEFEALAERLGFEPSELLERLS